MENKIKNKIERSLNRPESLFMMNYANKNNMRIKRIRSLKGLFGPTHIAGRIGLGTSFGPYGPKLQMIKIILIHKLKLFSPM